MGQGEGFAPFFSEAARERERERESVSFQLFFNHVNLSNDERKKKNSLGIMSLLTLYQFLRTGTDHHIRRRMEGLSI